ncbi:MAG: alpha/beta hydrolase [Gemmatimonadaceae bacterium]
MRGEFIDVGDARLYYFAAGSRGAGEPILLVHGFPASSHLWTALVPLLPSGHRVLVCDLLGYGRSDSPGPRDLSIRGHADRVVALMDALSVGSAAIVGHGLGGGIAQFLAVHYPDRVTRLCLCNSVGFDLWPDRRIRSFMAVSGVLRHVPPAVVTALFRRALSNGYANPNRGRHSIDQYLRPFATPAGRDLLLNHVRSLSPEATAELASALPGITKPTSIVWGAADPFLVREIAEALHRSIPGATLDFIPDIGHFVPEEAPEQLSQLVAQLMRR